MVTVTPLNTMLGRMATISHAMDQAFGTSNTRGELWMPSIDATETEQAYVVSLDLPGIDPSKVDVNFERNTLTVRGTRERVAESQEGTQVLFTEREWGNFERSMRFPLHVEGDKIGAAFNNGVLTITIPKSDAARPRRIAITGG